MRLAAAASSADLSNLEQIRPARLDRRTDELYPLEEYRRKRFLEEANQAFAALKMDPKAWLREIEERRLWESTGDGLEKD